MDFAPMENFVKEIKALIEKYTEQTGL